MRLETLKPPLGQVQRVFRPVDCAGAIHAELVRMADKLGVRIIVDHGTTFAIIVFV